MAPLEGQRIEAGEQIAHDRDLLRGYVAGRDDAFAALVRRYLPLVYHAALRQVDSDAHRAQDVAQWVFTLLARKAATLTHHQTLAGWLHTTARLVARDIMRAERRRRWREQEAQRMQEANSGPDPAAQWENLRPLLDETLGELNEIDREAVLLRFFANLPFAEVGVRLKVSENTARMRVERALERLHLRLTRRGVGSTAAALGLLLAQQASGAVPPTLAGTVTTSALAASASASAAGWIGFMSTAKTAWGVVALGVMLLMFGGAFYEWRLHQSAEAALAATQRERAARLADARSMAATVTATEAEAARLQHEIEAARAAVASARPITAAPPPPAYDLEAEGTAFLNRNPDVKQALADYVSASLRFQYAPLYREFGWTPEQIRQFEALRGRGTGMGGQLFGGRSISMRYGERSSAGEAFRALDAMMTPEQRVRFAEYTRTASARGVAADVAAGLYFTDTPLTSGQADQLVEILAQARVAGQNRPNTYDWTTVMANAATVLSSPQLAVLNGKRAEDLFNRAINKPANAPRPPAEGSGKK